ncbi:MAG: tRNA nucleotidyltransferase, partial [Acetanaerobacterium sp.]
MTMIELPHYVLMILDTLKRAGHRGCAVGGCVRDALMGNPPCDYDVATDATPERVRSLFEHTVPTGERFGTITVLIGHSSVEVTTFRTESGYADSRR